MNWLARAIVPLVIASPSHACFGERRGEERRGCRYAIACASDTGCVCPDDGCKQSRRCSLCNANV